MKGPQRLAAAGLDALPAGVRDSVRELLARRHVRRTLADVRPFLARVDAAIGGFDGRDIIEIGSDWGGSTLRAVDHLYAPRSLVGLNPGFAARRMGPRIRTLSVPAERSGLQADSVGGVFSTSAFEHIGDLTAVLAEMHRVLIPGGLLYSHFGPLWSTSYGHHLWVAAHGRVLNYHDVLLPPWCHLLSDRATVRKLLTPEHGAELAHRLTEFAFASDEQNQLFFDDYVRIVEESPFETVFLKGYDAPDLAAKYPSSHAADYIDQLRRRYPDRTGFLYDGITLLLRKRESPSP